MTRRGPNRRASIWFVTPAWRRYELSEVCFDQRLDVIRTLRAGGVDARCVVVADDENLDIAWDRGFDTVKRDNQWLGRRFNDGIEYAYEHNATWIVPIGSDSFIDPAYFLPLPDPSVTRTSPLYCHVRPDTVGELLVDVRMGAGPFMLHRSSLEACNARPALDRIARGCDTSTVLGIQDSNQAVIKWERRDIHPFQYLGFRGEPAVSSYETVYGRWGVREHANPTAVLSRHYKPDLVERALAALPNSPTPAPVVPPRPARVLVTA